MAAAAPALQGVVNHQRRCDGTGISPGWIQAPVENQESTDCFMGAAACCL
jgi:hypothetical protein